MPKISTVGLFSCDRPVKVLKIYFRIVLLHTEGDGKELLEAEYVKCLAQIHCVNVSQFSLVLQIHTGTLFMARKGPEIDNFPTKTRKL